MKWVMVVFSIFVLSAQSLTAEQKLKWRQILNECKTKTGVDDTLLEKHRQGIFVEDEKMKENYFCILQNLGVLNEHGDFQNERITFRFRNNYGMDLPQIEEFIRKCAIKRDTPQNSAFEYVKCFNENKPLNISRN